MTYVVELWKKAEEGGEGEGEVVASAAHNVWTLPQQQQRISSTGAVSWVGVMCAGARMSVRCRRVVDEGVDDVDSVDGMDSTTALQLSNAPGQCALSIVRVNCV